MNKSAPLCKLHSKPISIFGNGTFGCEHCPITDQVKIVNDPRLANIKCSDYGIISDRLQLEIHYADSYVSMKDPPLMDLVFHLLTSERPHDLMILSEFYRVGFGVMQSEEKALELLKSASIIPSAAERLACYYVSRNDFQAADSVLRVESASPRGMYIKAVVNKKKENKETYSELVEKSADMGYPHAVLLHGLHCLGFESVRAIDYKRASQYLAKAPKGSIREPILAIMHFNGDGFIRDLPRACEYALRVIGKSQNYHESYVDACKMIIESGQANDIIQQSDERSQAIETLENGIKSGKSWPFKYAIVQIYLGSNDKTTQVEYERAFSLCNEIFDETRATFAAWILSHLYGKGIGCERSIDKAIDYLKMALKNSDESEFIYERVYLEYLKNPNDTTKIIEKLQSCPGLDARISLANMLYKRGSENNNKNGEDREAFILYSECAKRLCIEAYYSKGCMLINGVENRRDILSGCEYLSEIGNYAPSFYPLGLCCYDGIFFEKNVEKSLKMLKKAYQETKNPDIVRAIKTILSREDIEDQSQWLVSDHSLH